MKYDVILTVSPQGYTGIEADTPEEAKAVAYSLFRRTVCGDPDVDALDEGDYSIAVYEEGERRAPSDR